MIHLLLSLLLSTGPGAPPARVGRLVVAPSDLRIVADAIVKQDGGYLLVGQLENVGDRAYSAIVVPFTVRNSLGENVEDIAARMERLEPGETADFEARVPIPGPTVSAITTFGQTTTNSQSSSLGQATVGPGGALSAGQGQTGATTSGEVTNVTSTANPLFYRPAPIVAFVASAPAQASRLTGRRRARR